LKDKGIAKLKPTFKLFLDNRNKNRKLGLGIAFQIRKDTEVEYIVAVKDGIIKQQFSSVLTERKLKITISSGNTVVISISLHLEEDCYFPT
jgi:hypothetical protein